MDPKTEKLRANGTMLSLEQLLISFTLPPLNVPDEGASESSDDKTNTTSNSSGTSYGKAEPGPGASSIPQAQPIALPACTLHNAGNDAFMIMFALQHLMEPRVSPSTSQSTKRSPSQSPPNSGQPQQQQQQLQRPRLHPHPSQTWPMVPMSPMGTPPITLNGSPMQNPMMIPHFSPYMLPHATGMGGMGLINGGAMGVNGAGMMGMSMTMPNAMARSKGGATYDLAGEFGNMKLPRTGSSGQVGDTMPSRGRKEGK